MGRYGPGFAAGHWRPTVRRYAHPPGGPAGPGAQPLLLIARWRSRWFARLLCSWLTPEHQLGQDSVLALAAALQTQVRAQVARAHAFQVRCDAPHMHP